MLMLLNSILNLNHIILFCFFYYIDYSLVCFNSSNQKQQKMFGAQKCSLHIINIE